MTMATVVETLMAIPWRTRAQEVSFSAAETVTATRAADVSKQYRVISSQTMVSWLHAPLQVTASLLHICYTYTVMA